MSISLFVLDISNCPAFLREKGSFSASSETLASACRAQGTAQADVIRAQGLSKAEGFKAQNEAIGATSTTLVNIATVLADKGAQFVPQILALGGGSAIDGLAATLTKVLAGQGSSASLPAKQERA